MPSFSTVLAVEHLDLEVELLAELLRLLAEPGRRAVVARPVAELARQGHAGGDRLAAAQAALHRLRVGLAGSSSVTAVGFQAGGALGLVCGIDVGDVGGGDDRGLGVRLAQPRRCRAATPTRLRRRSS